MPTICNPVLGMQRQEDMYKFKASVTYWVSSRTVSQGYIRETLSWNPPEKKEHKKNKIPPIRAHVWVLTHQRVELLKKIRSIGICNLVGRNLCIIGCGVSLSGSLPSWWWRELTPTAYTGLAVLYHWAILYSHSFPLLFYFLKQILKVA